MIDLGCEEYDKSWLGGCDGDVRVLGEIGVVHITPGIHSVSAFEAQCAASEACTTQTR